MAEKKKNDDEPSIFEQLFQTPGEVVKKGSGTSLQAARDEAIKKSGFQIVRDFFVSNPGSEVKEEDAD